MLFYRYTDGRGARWSEIDRDAAVWTVSAERMKAGREHRVPLSDRALAILDEARQFADSAGLVFPSATGRMPSQSGMAKLLHKVGIDAVPHGFRDWAAECTTSFSSYALIWVLPFNAP